MYKKKIVYGLCDQQQKNLNNNNPFRSRKSNHKDTIYWNENEIP